jgi:hypothetical protein
MPHNDRSRFGGTWPGELVPVPRDFRGWDVLQASALNGVDGSGLDPGWAPANPLIVGGAGLRITSAVSSFQSGFRTQQGGRAVLGANDFPATTVALAARRRTTTMPLFDAVDAIGANGFPAPTTFLQDAALALASPPGALGVSVGGLGIYIFEIPIPARYLHHGAHLESAILNYTIASRPAAFGTFSLPILCVLGRHVDAGSSVPVYRPNAPPRTGLLFGSLLSWRPVTGFLLNSYVIPSSPATTTGSYFKATSISGIGQSGAVGHEPNWASAPNVGNTVVDNPGANQIVWTNMGRSGQISAQSADAYYLSGKPQQLAADSFELAYSIDTASFKWVARIITPDPNMIMHSLQFVMSNITSMAFE